MDRNINDIIINCNSYPNSPYISTFSLDMLESNNNYVNDEN